MKVTKEYISLLFIFNLKTTTVTTITNITSEFNILKEKNIWKFKGNHIYILEF